MGAADLHSDDDEKTKELTQRLGEIFADQCAWAVHQNLEDTLEIVYLILGLDERTLGTRNLVNELSRPESLKILESWGTHAIAWQFDEFAKAFRASFPPKSSRDSLSHEGSAQRTRHKFHNLAKQTFLLTLITQPLAHPRNEQLYTERRRLRLWLVMQAAERVVQHGCPADSAISTVARYLILDSDDPRWEVVDQVLVRARQLMGTREASFDRFTNAVRNAAGQLHGEVTGRSNRGFLNSLIDIAMGICDPIQERTATAYRTAHLRKPRVASAPRVTFLSESTDTEFEVITEPTNDDEDQQSSFLVEIDPTDTPAEQALSSGSVFIQTAELAHSLPWSYDRPLPGELDAIDDWVAKTLTALDPIEQLGAALVWLSMRLSRSLNLLGRITIDAQLTEEWSLAPNLNYLKRTAPRRHSGWRPDETTIEEVMPFRDELHIAVPSDIQSVLDCAVKACHQPPSTLSELWQLTASISLEKWFNKHAAQHFERMTSGKLANRKAQELFDATGNPNFARLLSSHPNSALPGACSYASWDIAAIERGIDLPVRPARDIPDNVNQMGSLLVPIESVLTTEIQNASHRLEQARHRGLIHYHNAVVQYTVTALYAATGARPLRDPFESPQHFNESHLCVYINDKSDDSLHSGRLVPLPRLAAKMVAQYRCHLDRLATALAPHRADLADTVADLGAGNAGAVPYFFLLDQQLKWHSVGDAEQMGESLFNWSLPQNLFRHRYAQYLTSSQVNAEVVDGWMGHAERGAASYSDYSARCWQQDADYYRATVDQLFESLPFHPVATDHALPPLDADDIETSDGYTEPATFGIRARSKQRRRRLNEALREARDDIAIFLADRSIDDLDEQELQHLSNQMLLRDNHLPHPQAAIRFRTLAKMVERSATANKYRFRKRIRTVQDERSLVTAQVPQALSIQAQLTDWALRTRTAISRSSVAKTRSRLIGTALLAIEKRLSYKRLLTDVASGQHFRLVRNNQQYYIEYNEQLDPADYSAPVQRHEISYKTASLLSYGPQKKKTIDADAILDVPELGELVTLYEAYVGTAASLTTDNFLGWLSEIINQSNLVQLPGMVAAALSERQPPTSSSLTDFMRIVEGKAFNPGALEEDTQPNDLARSPASKTRTAERDKTTLQSNANQFTSEITGHLNRYDKALARDIAQNLQQTCDAYRGSVSISLLLLGYWLAAITHRGKGKPRKNFQPYAQNTLTTYWSSLVGPFQGLAYNVDLISLDSDAVTDLCAEMVEYKQTTTESTGYFGQRLKEFFLWAKTFGVESPDWSELDIDSDSRHVSAGLVTEPEYLSCLSQLKSDPGLNQDEQLMLGFVLLLSYRFGLRAQEAIGLLRRDWCSTAHYTWVLIRQKAYWNRTLKSASSRRAIPLLFTLAPIEQELIERVFARHMSLTGGDHNTPILCENAPDATIRLTSAAPRLSSALISVLRHVTGNAEIVLHHGRHTFYNRVASALLALETPIASQLSNDIDTQALRHCVLGPNNWRSRRTAMALARLMGHRFPSTGLKNYMHQMTEWADAWTPVHHPRAYQIPGTIDLTESPKVPKFRPQSTIHPELEYVTPTLSLLLKTLRLMALGMDHYRAGLLMRLNPDHLITLVNVIRHANDHMRFKHPLDKDRWIKGEDEPDTLLLLTSITDSGWQRLTQKAGNVTDMEALSDWLAPDLETLPYLVGQNRHLLMDRPEHCRLVRTVLDLFDVPDRLCTVVARFDDPSIAQMLENEGFSVDSEFQTKPQTDKKTGNIVNKEYRIQFDGFPINFQNRQYQSRQYGGLLLTRSRNGTIRNSFELALALLATGIAIHLPKTKSQDRNNY